MSLQRQPLQLFRRTLFVWNTIGVEQIIYDSTYLHLDFGHYIFKASAENCFVSTSFWVLADYFLFLEFFS